MVQVRPHVRRLLLSDTPYNNCLLSDTPYNYLIQWFHPYYIFNSYFYCVQFATGFLDVFPSGKWICRTYFISCGITNLHHCRFQKHFKGMTKHLRSDITMRSIDSFSVVSRLRHMIPKPILFQDDDMTPDDDANNNNNFDDRVITYKDRIRLGSTWLGFTAVFAVAFMLLRILGRMRVSSARK